ncbi:MAG: LacI family DNA-binding transcriptional regulator [Oscillospiraceae bacterium]
MAYSIIDVAKRAGISKSTVSRVINGGSVSEKAKTAVMTAIDEMEYRPNGLARGLRGMKSKIVGVVTLGTNAFEDPSGACRFAGMNNIFLNSGYSMLLINPVTSSTESVPANAFRYLQESRVDGLVFIGSIDSEQDRVIAQKYRSFVYTGERIDAKKGFRVYMGNYNYSRDLYSYLVSNGHSKILTVSSRSHSEFMIKRRLAAYKDVCGVFNIPYNISSFLSIFEASATDSEHLETIYDCFKNGNYTAIFTDTPELAHTIINYFTQRGLQLLKDYSIVCVERSGGEAQSKETLITGVCLPDYEYGQQCAMLMLEVLNNPDLAIKDVIIPYSFNIRNSVRNIGKL